jgi:hypothetical protein
MKQDIVTTKIKRENLRKLKATAALKQETMLSYNWALARWKDYRSQGRRVKMKDLKAEYNQIKGGQFPWVYEVTKCAPEQEFANLGQAFDNYWRISGRDHERCHFLLRRLVVCLNLSRGAA